MAAEPAGHAAVAALVTDTHVHDATVTVRLVKSFAYRTVKLIVLHGIDLTTATPIGLRAAVADHIATHPGFKPFLSVNYDTFKIYHMAHAAKSSDLAVNRDHDELILRDDASLWENGVRHETEVSLFNRDMYEEYKKMPNVQQW